MPRRCGRPLRQPLRVCGQELPKQDAMPHPLLGGGVPLLGEPAPDEDPDMIMVMLMALTASVIAARVGSHMHIEGRPYDWNGKDYTEFDCSRLLDSMSDKECRRCAPVASHGLELLSHAHIFARFGSFCLVRRSSGREDGPSHQLSSPFPLLCLHAVN